MYLGYLEYLVYLVYDMYLGYLDYRYVSVFGQGLKIMEIYWKFIKRIFEICKNVTSDGWSGWDRRFYDISVSHNHESNNSLK